MKKTNMFFTGSKQMPDQLAKIGVWTPVAAVLCLECHGPKFPNKTFDLDSEEWKIYTELKVVRSHEDVTFCDWCKTEVSVWRNVAKEHNLTGELEAKGFESEMMQTGGMNSAASVRTKDGGYYMAVFDLDGNRKWQIARHDKEDEWMPDSIREFDTQKEVVDFFEKSSDVKRAEG